jgi:hypothetical protein
MSPAHMLENLGAYDFNLTASEVTQLYVSSPVKWAHFYVRCARCARCEIALAPTTLLPPHPRPMHTHVLDFLAGPPVPRIGAASTPLSTVRGSSLDFCVLMLLVAPGFARVHAILLFVSGFTECAPASAKL